MPAQLKALTGGPCIPLDKPILLLGRHPECDIQIDSRKVSRRHCCIAQVGDYLIVRDLGSTNGIRINGVRVLEGRLNNGDELTIGNHRYQIHWDELPGENGHSRDSLHEASPADGSRRSDDDILEACDEPVPLAEPPALAPPNGLKPSRKAEPGAQNVQSAARDRAPGSMILPEHLELAPPSDAFPHPSSGSHHPP